MGSNRIFSTKWQKVQEQVEAFRNFSLPPDLTHLTGISYGQISTTTVSNIWFGTKANVEVTLNIIMIDSVDVAMLAFSNYYTYSAFVQEIIKTLTYPANEDVIASVGAFFQE